MLLHRLLIVPAGLLTAILNADTVLWSAAMLRCAGQGGTLLDMTRGM